MRLAALAIAAASLLAQDLPLDSAATFGTTVVSSSGLRGTIYEIPPGTDELPNLRKRKPLGTIYTTSLRVAPRSFLTGFPGVSDRFEWFAIDYDGRFWIETPGVYRFRLQSDDGSKLWLNGKLVIDNDGLHPPRIIEGSAHLTRGIHQLRVAYFQGPRAYVALVMAVASPGAEWRYFDTDQFLPPADPALWIQGKISHIKRGENW
jgi:hypothetical protein